MSSVPLYMQNVDRDTLILPTGRSGEKNEDALYVDPDQSEHQDPSFDYAEYVSEGEGLQSFASMRRDGRISLKFDLKGAGLTDIPQEPDEDVVEFAVDKEWKDCPPMNIVIMIVGSRGDVQPYVALGHQLTKDGHRVRIATHETFRTFVTDAGLEFFNIGGDPQDLMSYMVKNPGLMPGFASLTNGDIARKRKMLKEMIHGCWHSCHSPCTVTGRSFAADAIISNPPSFAHVHCAEALGIPLLLSFTMPWSPTSAFPHPLVHITSSNASGSITNHMSYTVADLLTWQGVGDIINQFRVSTLGLSPLTLRSGPMLADRLKVPWTYCMSPALVPKPADWKNNIDVVGFYFLDLATKYTPPEDLAAFLAAGEPPVYIGFGSVVVDDAAAMSQTIFEATAKAGVRALVSAGWGGLGGISVPPHVHMLGNVPHDWLFDKERVTAVVHHGGAGTTAIGLAKGRPTVVVPFFGDQGFWGSMIHKAGAGPKPIPQKELNVKSLTEAIKFAISPPAKEAAKILAKRIHDENGVQQGVDSFYKHLPLLNMRCDLDPSRLAIWWSPNHCLKLSTFAAQVLSDAKIINFHNLILHRPKEHMTRNPCVPDSVFWHLTCPKKLSVDVAQYAMAQGISRIKKSSKCGIKGKRSYGKHGIANALVALHEGFSNLDFDETYEEPLPEFKPYKVAETNPPKKRMLPLEEITTLDKTKEALLVAFQERKALAIETAKRSGLGLVTLPMQTKWKAMQSNSSKSHERRQRISRIANGRELVALSKPAERAYIIRRFQEEAFRTPARQQQYRDVLQEAGMDENPPESDEEHDETEVSSMKSANASTIPSSRQDSVLSSFTNRSSSTWTADTSMIEVSSGRHGFSSPTSTHRGGVDDEDAQFVHDMEEAMKKSLDHDHSVRSIYTKA